MPRHDAPIKRMRQDKKKSARNRSLKAAVKTAARKVRLASTEDSAKILPAAVSIIDRAAKKNAIHWRTAARLKSRLAKRAAKRAS